MNDISLRLLQAFVTLAREQQFRKAAEAFHVTQSALSQMIVRLEDQLGVKLVDRTSRRMSMTAHGEALLPLAQQLERQVELIFLRLRDLSDYREANIAFTAIPALTADWLPEIMARFRAARPATRLILHDTPDLDDSIRLLREGTVDFMVRPVVGHSDEFESTPLFEERFFLVCPTSNPLAQRRGVRLRELGDFEYIRLSPAGTLGKILDPLLVEAGIGDGGMKLQYHASIAALVAREFGVSVVPGFSTVYYERPGIARVPVTDPKLRRQFHVVRRRGDVSSRSLVLLLDMIRQNLPAHTVPMGLAHSRGGRPPAARRQRPRDSAADAGTAKES
ncbi:MAG: LysR family transcriptional regulator [Lautropia sp.]